MLKALQPFDTARYLSIAALFFASLFSPLTSNGQGISRPPLRVAQETATEPEEPATPSVNQPPTQRGVSVSGTSADPVGGTAAGDDIAANPDQSLTQLPAPPTEEEMKALGERVQQLAEDDATKQSLLNDVALTRQALADGNQRLENTKGRVDAAASVEQSATLLAEEIAAFEAMPQKAVDKSQDLQTLELELATINTQLQDAERRKKQYDSEVADEANMLKTWEDEANKAPGQIASLRDQLTNIDPDLPPIQREARTALIRAELWKAKQTLDYATADVRFRRTAQAVKFFQLRQKKTALEVDRLKQYAAALQSEVAAKRQEKASQQMTDAEAAVSEVLPALKSIAEGLTPLSEELTELNQRTERAQKRRDEAAELLGKWEGEKAKLETMVESDGLTEITGLKLREKLSRLDDLTDIRNRMSTRPGRMRTAQYRRSGIEVELENLEDVEAAALRMASNANPNAAPTATLLADATRLVEQRTDLLTDLKISYDNYISALEAVDNNEQRAVATVTELHEFITGRMLWIRSHPSMVDFDDLAPSWLVGERARWFLMPSSYALVGTRLTDDFTNHPVLYAIAAVFLAVLLIGQQWLRVQIRVVSERGRRRANVSVRPLLRLIGMTIADAAVWPGLLAFIALRLQVAFTDDPEIYTSAGALVRIAIALFLTELIHDACLSGGIAELLGVPADVAAYIRRKVFSLEVIGAPIAIIVALLHTDNAALAMRGVERIAFIMGMFLLSRFANQMLRSKSPIVRMLSGEGQRNWLIRFRMAFWIVGVLVPIAIAVLSVIGYHNTALQLCGKLELTVWWGVGLLTIRLILATAVMLHRRKLRFEEIRQRIEEQKDADSTEGVSSDTPSGLAASVTKDDDEDRETLTSRLAGQSQQLIASIAGIAFLIGAYMIWTDVLPALDVVTQWSPYSVGADKTPITVGRLLLAAVVIGATLTGAKNLPGLLELSVLQRLGFDRSVRYAITTLLSYAITVLGILIAGDLVGLTWSSVQWLAAGLTVGLGFGLQEIFANFISGLIIFFEQPVRVGDVVTLSDVTGVVSRIRMRATTITNWDRKEYIVPNKEFITGRLLNWTLSDTTNRLVLGVGVAYGSDTDKARSVILEILDAHQHVLKDPVPMVTLEALGDSSLNFTIRCFLQALDTRLMTTHEIYSEIHRRFIKEGIEIPFPQTDLHIRDAAPFRIERPA